MIKIIEAFSFSKREYTPSKKIYTTSSKGFKRIFVKLYLVRKRIWDAVSMSRIK